MTTIIFMIFMFFLFSSRLRVISSIYQFLQNSCLFCSFTFCLLFFFLLLLILFLFTKWFNKYVESLLDFNQTAKINQLAKAAAAAVADCWCQCWCLFISFDKKKNFFFPLLLVKNYRFLQFLDLFKQHFKQTNLRNKQISPFLSIN